MITRMYAGFISFWVYFPFLLAGTRERAVGPPLCVCLGGYSRGVTVSVSSWAMAMSCDTASRTGHTHTLQQTLQLGLHDNLILL